jgi:beta-phosphoglucomutase family hydrolase
MSNPPPARHRIAGAAYDAWLFDLDGVVTRTARVHAAAWKQVFDLVLATHAQRTNAPFAPFTLNGDYHRYVDGKPRYDGVADFLSSRGITLPWGDPTDPPEAMTICGVGNRKNRAFNTIVHEQGVECFPAAVDLIATLRESGKATAVVTSSKNCTLILQTAELTGLFDVQIDGVVAAAEGLAGKPAPATFLAAAERLAVPPQRAVVVEDAEAGVQAGRAGAFGLVIGVDHAGDPARLQAAGADIVVADLAEITLSPQ